MDEKHELDLARVLLSGYVKEKDGCLSSGHYLENKDEQLAREAIARILRSDRPLDPRLRRLLASLFDPHSENPRYLEFKHRRSPGRRRGTTRQTDHVRNSSIAQLVHQAIKAGNSQTKASEIVGTQVGLTDGAVKAIWRRYRRFYDRVRR